MAGLDWHGGAWSGTALLLLQAAAANKHWTHANGFGF